MSICNGSKEGLAILVGIGKDKQQGLDPRHVMHRASFIRGIGGGATRVVSTDRFPVEMKA